MQAWVLCMKPHVKLFISSSEVDGVFGGGKWLLLDAVRREGSIFKAADSLGRSYRKAWGDIKRAEEGFGQALVTKVRGGKSGGGASLTDFAQSLLVAWDDFHAEVETASQRAFKKHVAPVLARHGGILKRDKMR